ncbi:hypothetical protein OIU85_005807 [Salix viminalis]|uniref:N-acetyltransferase domain-containing protein n=1 Tax=Salix viminalis TaxID=40686 RepID=A0A9Q0PJP2_SALVM|nr:hypothetical protein OIU85_005807 [Salix viminalis]
MAAAIPFSVSLSLSSDSQPSKRLPVILTSSNLQLPFLSPHKSLHFSSRSLVSSKCSSPSPPPPSPPPPPSSTTITTTTTTTSTETSSASTTYSYLEDSYKTGRFLSNEEIEKLNALQDFRYHQQLETGSMCVRLMRLEEMDITVKLLAESFVESMVLPVGYVSLLRYLVKQYLIERRAAMPHAVTLIGFYKAKQEMDAGEEMEDVEELAGTVEVCFDKRGANTSPPTPTSPKNAPYICNMAVKGSLRRRGIGWNLLKASEELISQMSSMQDVYLHCRMIDSAPLQHRRKHLMCKKLAVLKNPSELDIPGSDTKLSSQLDMLKS